MKRLRNHQYFAQWYLLGAGALLFTLSLFLKNRDYTLFFGALFLLFGSIAAVLNWRSWQKEEQIKKLGKKYLPQTVQVIPCNTRGIHTQGLFYFVLSCTYQDEQGTVHTVQSEQLFLPAWSSHVIGTTLTTMPTVTIYVMDQNSIIEAYL